MGIGPEGNLAVGELQLDILQKSVRYQRQTYTLSPTAFSLLAYLMEKSPAVVSVDDMLDVVWQGKVVNRETVKQQVISLRKQLGAAADYVVSVRGHGYKVLQPADEKQNPIHIPASTAPTLHKKNKLFGQVLKRPLALILTALVLFVTAFWFYPTSNIALPIRIVVLPYEFIGNRDAPLPRRLQDELVTALSKQDDVRVMAISVTDSAIYEAFSHQDYAEQLDVDLIFEGSIVKTGAGSAEQPSPAHSVSYQVNMRAARTRDGATVWREQISFEHGNQDRLINQVVEKATAFVNRKTAFLQANAS